MDNLPPELLYRVALDMDYDALQNFCKTSHFKTTICKNGQFWEDKARKEFILGDPTWEYLVGEAGSAQEAYVWIAAEHDVPFWGAEKYGHIDKLAKNAAWTDDLLLIKHFYKLSTNSDVFYILGKRNKTDFISSFPVRDLKINGSAIIYGALVGNHLDLVKDIRSQYYSKKLNFSAAMRSAAKSGQISVVEFVLQSTNTNNEERISGLNRALLVAVKNNYLDMIKFLIGNGADDFDDALYEAAKAKNFPLVKEIVSLLKNENIHWNKVLLGASRGGIKEIIDYALNHGADYLSMAMLDAARGGHIDILEYLISKGAADYIGALLEAISGGDIPTIQWLAQKLDDLDIEFDIDDDIDKVIEIVEDIITTDNVQLYNIARNIFNYDEVNWSAIIDHGSSKILRAVLQNHKLPQNITIKKAGKNVNVIFVLLDYQVKQANIPGLYNFKLQGRPEKN